MAQINAAITDLIDTMVNAKNYSLEASRTKLHKAITNTEFEISLEKFLKAFTRAHEKYHTVRYRKLREVTNAKSISETLNNIELKTKPGDSKTKTAINSFFQDYVALIQFHYNTS